MLMYIIPNINHFFSFLKCLCAVTRQRKVSFFVSLCPPSESQRFPKSSLAPIIGNELWDLSSVDYFPSGARVLKSYQDLYSLYKIRVNLL
jgi:hypothetical protein